MRRCLRGKSSRGRTTPPEPKQASKRGSLALAAATAMDPGRLKRARGAFIEGFSANSARETKTKKRIDVEKLARLVGAIDGIYPLDYDTVVNVAATLKAGGLKSADSYMTELKLGHVESKHEVPAWLTRLLYQCRLSFNRGKGPAAKAPELQFEDLDEDAKLRRGAGPGEVQNPFESFVVAVRWMLREIEVSAIKLAHVTFVEGEYIAVLFLPSSKADSGGTGTARRLRCTCGSGRVIDVETCPYHVIRNQVELIKLKQESGGRAFDPWKEPLFPTVAGGVASKTVMVAGWRTLAAGHEVGGHTPRRSGAKRMAKEGWPILAIQHLGRWASSTVLSYVEEAYAEKPCGKAIVVDDGDSPLPSLEDRVTKLEGLRGGADNGCSVDNEAGGGREAAGGRHQGLGAA